MKPQSIPKILTYIVAAIIAAFIIIGLINGIKSAMSSNIIAMPILPKPLQHPWIRKAPKTFGNEDTPFYQSNVWRKFRRSFLLNHPLCVECEKKGIVKAATIVDHIKRIQDGGEKLDESNCQSLCNDCHNSKRGREAHDKNRQREGGKNPQS